MCRAMIKLKPQNENNANPINPMARIRTIKPSFWKDQKLARLKRDIRLMFIGLWNLADDEGIVHADASLIKSELFPFEEDLRVTTVQEWIDQLTKARIIIPFVYNDESYYYIRTFTTHQSINRPQDSKIPKEFIHGLISEHSVNNHGAFTVGMEGNGKEGKGGEAPPPDASVCFNVESEVVSNQIWLEAICMKTNRSIEAALESLHKYHLHLVENGKYPRARQALFAGFEKWLLNEKLPAAVANKYESDLQLARKNYKTIQQ